MLEILYNSRMTCLPELDEYAFKELKEHLLDAESRINRYRKSIEDGRIHNYGIVRKPNMAPDLSKDSWLDPRLHYLLMKFARLHVPFEFTTIQVNDNYLTLPHKDIHNVGQCYIVAFGEFTNGELVLNLPAGRSVFNIKNRPMQFDSSAIEYNSTDFKGRRWSLMYFTLKAPKNFPIIRSLSDYDAVSRDGHYVIAFYKLGEPVEYLSKKNGLPVLRKHKKPKEQIEVKSFVYNSSMSLAQNMMLQARQDEFYSSSQEE